MSSNQVTAKELSISTICGTLIEGNEMHDLLAPPRQDSISSEKKVQLVRLATEIARSKRPSVLKARTEKVKPAVLADLTSCDPTLDPNDPHFDVYKWTKTVLAAATREGVQFRRAGFAFRNLNVSGSGRTAKLQETVLSVPLSIRLPDCLGCKKAPTRPILRDFHGIVRSGEMLLVLGRTGSGCSTLLKTIAGEVHGLKMDKQSSMHYSGTVFKEST
jgi:ATP-binding cassette, subfamily G (WHITE), member 2, PDR